MESRFTKPAIAAVVLTAALAVGVERLARPRTDRTHAFSAEIRANTALDLDPRAAIPLRQSRPEDFDVTWDGEAGGTLRIMSGSSLRLSTPSWPDAKWEEVVGWAHSILGQIQESTTTSIAARKNRFAAILTSEGNLAVVQIGEYDKNKAQLQWQVESTDQPGYGPVQVVTLACVDPNHPSAQPCAIDFDTGRTSVIPAQVLNLAPEGFLDWLEQNGIDAIARMTDTGAGLSGVGLAYQGISPGVWTVVPAMAARDIVGGIPYQSRDPILFQQDQYQVVLAFRTREGAVGILEMRGVDRAGPTVQFRYKLVQQDPSTKIESQAQEEDDSLQLYTSARWLCDLGRNLLIYANDHEDRLPQSLEELRESTEDEKEYQWMIHDLEYLGAGVTCANSPSLVVAYDKTLLGVGKGTNVLFLDSHIEYVGPERLAEYGLSDGVEAVMQKNAERGRRDLSRSHLERLGRSLRIYGNFNKDRLPQSLEEIRQHVGREDRYQWIVENVEYLGAGLLFSQSPSLVVAYDKTLLAAGKGTNVLFLDIHTEFVEPDKLAKHGLPAEP